MRLIPALLLSATALFAQEPPLYVAANFHGGLATLAPDGDILLAAVGDAEKPLYLPCSAGSECTTRTAAGQTLYFARLRPQGGLPVFKTLLELPEERTFADQVLPLRNGGYVVSTRSDAGQTVFRFEAGGRLRWRRPLPFGRASVSIAEHPDGRLLYHGFTGLSEPLLGVFSSEGEIMPSPLEAGGQYVSFSPDGSLILTGSVPSASLAGTVDPATTPGAYQSELPAGVCSSTGPFASACPHQVVAHVSADLQTLHFLTLVTGERDSRPSGPAIVRPDGAIVLFGTTSSAHYPVTPDAWQPRYPASPLEVRGIRSYHRLDSAAFLTVLAPGGASLLYSTYLGGIADTKAVGMEAREDGLLLLRGKATSVFPGLGERTETCAPLDQRGILPGYPAPASSAASFEMLFDLESKRPVRSYLAEPTGLSDRASIRTALFTGQPPPGVEPLPEAQSYLALDILPPSPPADDVALTCLEDPATLAPQPAEVAPGQIVALFGRNWPIAETAVYDGSLDRLPLELAGVSLRLEGGLVPLLYVSPAQINFAAPSTLQPGETALLELLVDGEPVAERRLTVVRNGPALFRRLTDRTFNAEAEAVLASGERATRDRRVPSGEPVHLFLNGVGLNLERQHDGEINRDASIEPPAPVHVEGADVLSWGPAPGAPAGIWRLVLRLTEPQDPRLKGNLSIRVGDFELPPTFIWAE